jgi:glycosyltransferase involved in cell wall biosynthesis
MRLSLAMIVRDEEDVLARCLECVQGVVDEIIIADTGSGDRTKEIARRYTNKVYDFVWCDDFSAARNFAFSKATGDFIMWLDADDYISPQNAEKIRKLLNGRRKFDIAYLKYTVGNNFSYYRERIVRRSIKPIWAEPVHEVIIAKGRTIMTDIAVEHKKLKQNPAGRNLKIMEAFLSNGGVFSPRLTYYYARELMFNGRTEDAAAAFEKFLSMSGGWAENKISAHLDLANCYQKTGQPTRALTAAFGSFEHGEPRAEICCKIGELFFNAGRWKLSAYWYRAASKCKLSKNNLGFIQRDYYGFIPAIQLAVVYDRLGRKKTAQKYNERAGKYKPAHPAYLHNKEYFSHI